MRERDSLAALNAISRARRTVFERLESLFKPSIAAINGVAAGGGCEVALACTLRLAADTARFGQPEIHLGIIPGLGGTQRLTRLVGKGKAMELVSRATLSTPRRPTASDLVNHVYPAAELMNEAKKLATKLAEKAPIAVRCAKDAVNLGYDMPLLAALVLENRLFSITCGTEDKKEGVAAFLRETPTDLARAVKVSRISKEIGAGDDA